MSYLNFVDACVCAREYVGMCICLPVTVCQKSRHHVFTMKRCSCKHASATTRADRRIIIKHVHCIHTDTETLTSGIMLI